MKNPFKITQEIISQVMAVPEIGEYCRSSFGRDLLYLISLDILDEPGIGSCPMLVVSPFSAVPDRSRGFRTTAFRCMLAVASLPFRKGDDGVLYTPTTGHIFGLYSLVEAAITGHLERTYLDSFSFSDCSHEIAMPFSRIFFTFSVQEDY